MAQARGALVPIDILINNAGIALPAPIDDPSFDDAWAATLAVNLTAYTRTIRAALADLTRDGAGRIVNVASPEGLGATAAMAAYTAPQPGVVGLTRALAAEQIGRASCREERVRTGRCRGSPDNSTKKTTT